MSKLRFSKVFTYLGAVFLMSHIIFCNNVGAVETVIDLSNYELIDSSTILQINSTYVNGNTGTTTNCTNSWSCAAPTTSSNNNWTIRNLYTTTSFANQVGDIVEFDIVMYGPTNWSTLHGFNYLMPSFSSSEWDVLSVSKTIDNSFYSNYSTILNGTTEIQAQGYTYNAVYHYILRAKSNSALPLGWRYQSSIFTYTSSDPIRYALMSYSRFRIRGDGSSKDQENEINATNDAVDNSETSGDQASTDANTATSSLLSVIGGFANVITSASPSNCVIDAPLNTAFSNDRFNVDLCSLDLPAGIGALTSIIAIMIVVPFCISMFNKFIGIISGFQQ